MSVNIDLPAIYSPLDFTNPNTPHDRVLVVEDTKFYIFAGHLSFCSEFFRTLFNGNFAERKDDEIELKELDADHFHSFLKVLVPGNHSALNVTNYVPIMKCARRFLAYDVLNICETFVLQNFTSLDKIELLEMAFEYNWDKLKEKVVDSVMSPKAQETKCRYRCGREVDLDGYCPYCRRYSDVSDEKPALLDRNSFLVQNKDKIVSLPCEIHSFLLEHLLNKAMNY